MRSVAHAVSGDAVNRVPPIVLVSYYTLALAVKQNTTTDTILRTCTRIKIDEADCTQRRGGWSPGESEEAAHTHQD